MLLLWHECGTMHAVIIWLFTGDRKGMNISDVDIHTCVWGVGVSNSTLQPVIKGKTEQKERGGFT